MVAKATNNGEIDAKACEALCIGDGHTGVVAMTATDSAWHAHYMEKVHLTYLAYILGDNDRWLEFFHQPSIDRVQGLSILYTRGRDVVNFAACCERPISCCSDSR